MPDILIIGAGPTGLTLACELAVWSAASDHRYVAAAISWLAREGRLGLGARPDVPWPSPVLLPQWRTERDAEGHASAAWEPSASALFAMRPDGVIGFATDRLDPAALESWLRATGLTD